jgi:flagellar hook-associated protein 1 FlgK
MSSLFNTLNVGYTGLSAAQAQISTTGHNIANAETEGYTRQRVVTSASDPLKTAGSGLIGNGVGITDIERVFDSFVYDRYKQSSSDKAYSDYQRQNLEKLSTYFPEIENSGIKADLQEYFSMWQNLVDNPDNDSMKTALAKQTELLTSHISQTQEQIVNLQSQINDELKISIDLVNDKAKEISELNVAINLAENETAFSANDLRDKRDLLEKELSDLIGSEVFTSQQSASSNTDTYTININGYNIVDGGSYHPLTISNENNAEGFYEVYYKRQNSPDLPIMEELTKGKVGAMLDLRGSDIDTTSGMPTDGVIQNVISQLDAFATGLIESTNNLYAANSTTDMLSNNVELSGNDSILNSSLNINEGSFNIVIYDIDGNVAATREINIDVATSMEGIAGSNSIQGQILMTKDDNDDGNANNDIDDFIQFNWATYNNGESALEFQLDQGAESRGYSFAIEDNLTNDSYSSGSNFAGALGLNRFFDGKDAQSIELNAEIKENNSLVSAGKSALSGDNRIASSMVQQQYENFDFKVGQNEYNTTVYGMFDLTATNVGISANSAIARNETVTAQFNASELEYTSVSGVSIDEELTNLIKYQTSYGAAAKIITTVDQMMQTLLGLKQ